MLQGSLSQTTRTCSSPGCHCHQGQRHGPHTYLTWKTPEGRSTALYVPAHAVPEAEAGVAAWKRFWDLAVALAAVNRQAAQRRWRPKGRRRARRRDAATRR